MQSTQNFFIPLDVLLNNLKSLFEVQAIPLEMKKQIATRIIDTLIHNFKTDIHILTFREIFKLCGSYTSNSSYPFEISNAAGSLYDMLHEKAAASGGGITQSDLN